MAAEPPQILDNRVAPQLGTYVVSVQPKSGFVCLCLDLAHDFAMAFRWRAGSCFNATPLVYHGLMAATFAQHALEFVELKLDSPTHGFGLLECG